MRLILTTILESEFEPRFCVVYKGKPDALFIRHHDAVAFIDGSMALQPGALLKDNFQIITLGKVEER